MKATYHVLIQDGRVHSHAQSPIDQAYAAIGANVVTGFPVHRYAVADRDGQPLIVVSVHASTGLVFGAYEFSGV